MAGFVAATNIKHGGDDGLVEKSAGEKVTESDFGKDAFKTLQENGAIVKEGSREYHEAFGYPDDETFAEPVAPPAGEGGGS